MLDNIFLSLTKFSITHGRIMNYELQRVYVIIKLIQPQNGIYYTQFIQYKKIQ